MISKSLHPSDYANLNDGIALLYKGLGWAMGSGIRVVMPHENRNWEYGSVLQYVHDHPKIMKVLDVGAGMSPLGPALLLKGCHLTEVDFSPNVDRSAIERAFPSTFSFARMDFLDTEEGETYDLVTCVSMAEHVKPQDQEQFWRKLARAVAPEGALIATVDYAQDASKVWTFDHERDTKINKEILEDIRDWMELEGLTGEWDFTWYGPQVHDYSFYRIILERQPC